MSKTLKTTFRSYASIEDEANRCRQIGNLSAALEFNIVDFIVGPLSGHFKGRLKINIVEKVAGAPAEVCISPDRKNINLYVEKETWDKAANKDAQSRRVLAHEVGHIWLHADETFQFSDVSESEHPFIQKEYLVEDQAHSFADCFIAPTIAISGFETANNLLDYSELYLSIPDDTLIRQHNRAIDRRRYDFKPIYDGKICQNCGGDKVRSLFSHTKCDTCGFSSY